MRKVTRVGKLVRAGLDDQNLTQIELAEKANLTRATISGLLRKPEAGSFNTLKKVADILKLNPIELATAAMEDRTNA